MEKQQRPDLRFPKFEKDWEIKQLKDLLDFKNGINASKEEYGSGFKFINVLDIIQNDFITHDNIIGSVNVPEEVFDKNIVEYGDILFQRSSETREEVGQSNVYLDKEKNATFGGFVIRGKKKTSYEPFFFHSLLKTSSARKEITSKSGGSTRYNVGQETLSSVSLYFPKITEQQKIASFLSAVDKKIELLQQKKRLLEDYKKGVMQQIFSQELRFKNEEGDEYPEWEEKPLGNLGTFKGGGTPSKNNLDYWNGEIPWISSSDLIEDDIHNINITRFISEKAINESATKIISKRSVLFISRVGVGKVAVNEEEVCTSQDFINFTPTMANSYFLAYLFISKKNILRSFCQGTSIKGFVKSDLESLKISIPHIEEQTQIANFLSALDEKIALVNTQIENTQEFKKGLLQQMFV
jgi:type I restriction enzyme S subunit